MNGPKTSIACFYKHLPRYPAFLNSACFKSSPEVNPATCSSPCSHHGLDSHVRISPSLPLRTKLKLMSKFGKWRPEGQFHGADQLMGAGSLHCEVTEAANNALLNLVARRLQRIQGRQQQPGLHGTAHFDSSNPLVSPLDVELMIVSRNRD